MLTACSLVVIVLMILVGINELQELRRHSDNGQDEVIRHCRLAARSCAVAADARLKTTDSQSESRLNGSPATQSGV